MNENAPSSLTIQAREDKRTIKRKGIKAPDIKDLPYSIYDKRQKAKFFFGSKEKFDYALERLTKQSGIDNLKITTPKLKPK